MLSTAFTLRLALIAACASCEIHVPILFHSPPRSAGAAEWTQDAHDAQRTGYSPEQPLAPFTFAWTWNGPDAEGGQSGHWYDAPPEARVVVGNGKVYAPAGSAGIYGIRLSDGGEAWHVHPSGAAFVASAAYDHATNTVLAGAGDGTLYQINADSGDVVRTYAAGAPIEKATLIAGEHVYVVSQAGGLHKLRIADLAPIWVYRAGSAGATPPAYSAALDALVFGTADLVVHVVHNADGSLKWKRNPSVHSGDAEHSYQYAWPVIADAHGLVLMRMRLSSRALYDSVPGGRFPNSMGEIRAALQQQPEWQSLFALDLASSDGATRFIPAVGYTGVEHYVNGANDYEMGTLPIVRTYPDGSQVAYMAFRSGQSGSPDYRWDGALGEMSLEDTSRFGAPMRAGDLRFVRMSGARGSGIACADCTGRSYIHVVDEGTPITMAGDMLIHSHWSAAVMARIRTNPADPRWAGRGFSFADPIPTDDVSIVVRAQSACPDKGSDHSTTCGLRYVTDSPIGQGRTYREFDAPGKLWWVYWNVADPPGARRDGRNAPGEAYSAGFLPRTAIVSSGHILIQGNGGDLFVLKHSGR